MSVLRREAARLVPYVAMVAFCLALVAVRVDRTGSLVYTFLVWNLVLAAVPLALTTALRLGERVHGAVAVPVLALWLLFLPNAPYILTDLIHLADKPPVPMWYDLALLLAAAGTGVALGYRSLLDAEAVVRQWVGPRVSAALVVGALFLSGFGIYLGRYVRLNSWEAVTDPAGVFAVAAAPLADPLAHTTAWGVTVLFGAMLSLGYLALRPAPAATRS